MTSSGEVVVVRRTQMVGPPYLYRGAQVCGRRTSRTCIFLLLTFGAASAMIGLVLFTADLDLRSGMWAAGVVMMALGVVLLTWFLTLCCAARVEYYSLPAAHPARGKSPRPVMHPVATSTPAYQLLPLTHTRGRPPSHNPSLIAAQNDGYMNQNESYIENTGSLMRGHTGSMMRGQGSLMRGQGSLMRGQNSLMGGQTGSLMRGQDSMLRGQTGSMMRGQTSSYVGRSGSYLEDQTGRFMREPAASYMGGQSGNYMESPTGSFREPQSGSYLEKPIDNMGGQRSSYSAGQDNRYNEALRNSPRRSKGYETQPPPSFTPERQLGYPTQHTWDHRLGHSQVYPMDGGSWGSLARSSPMPHLHEYPGSHMGSQGVEGIHGTLLPSHKGSHRPEGTHGTLGHMGSQRPEGIHGTLLPGSRHSVGYSPGPTGTLGHRQSRPDDQPPAYCDLIPH